MYFGAAIAPEEQLDAALARAGSYVDAGADGVFLPGCTDAGSLRAVVDATSAPVNVMHWPGLPAFAELCDIGVRRISQGASAFLYAVAGLERLTTGYLNDAPDDFGGDLTPAFHLLRRSRTQLTLRPDATAAAARTAPARRTPRCAE